MKIGNKDPMKLRAPDINWELDALDAESSKICDRLILCGRGSELPRDTLRKNDPLSKDYRAISERYSSLRAEVEIRYGTYIHRLPIGRDFGPRKR